MRTQRTSISVLAAIAVSVIAVGAYAQGDPAPPVAGDPAAPPATDQPAPPATDQPAPPDGTAPTTPEGTPPPPVTETKCGDGLDDDGDTSVDCADTDCQTDPACKPPEPPPVVAPVQPPTVAPAPAAPAPVAAPVVPPEADKSASKPPPATTLGIEGVGGVTGRVGSISSGYDASERAGLQFGGGLFFAPNRQFAFGLSYLYSNLGSEEFDPAGSDTSGKIRRRLHNAAANLRAYPIRSDVIGLWAGLAVGLTWQTASASGAQATGSFAEPSRTYQTDVGPNSGLALGASIGMDYDVSNDVAMLTSINFTNHRLSSDALDGSTDPTVPGIGSTSQLDFRLAFQYRFDVSGASSPVSASVETASK